MNRDRSLWKDADFRRFWIADGISQVGTQISLLALPLIAAVTLDASPFEVGLLAAAGQAPALVLGLFAGAWIDRRKRRPVMVSADLGRAALLSIVPVAHAFDILSMGLLALIAFAVGMLTVLFDIGYLSYVPSLVGKGELVNANSALQATASGAQVAGPGIGGALVGVLGGPAALLIDAGSFLLSALMLGRIRRDEPTPVAHHREESLRAQVGAGIKAVRGDALILTLFRASMLTNLFGYLFLSVYVLFMVRDLDLSSSQVGLVFALGGVGALIGSIAAGPLERRFGTGPVLVWSQFAFGATGMLVPVAVLAPSIALPMILASEFLQWMALLVYSINAMSLRQRRTDDAIQGRVHATFLFATRGLQPLGSIAGGIVGTIIGLPLTLVVGEIGMFLAFAVLWWSPVRKASQFPDTAGGAESLTRAALETSP